MRVLACTILLAVAVCGCGGPAHPPSEPSVANPVQGRQTLPSTGRTTAQPQPSTARARAASAASLRALGLALQEYADNHGCFPPAAVHGKGGQPLLSWRVLLLPYLDQESLFKEFHLEEPWDSPHNQTLLARMPGVYAPAAGQAAEPYTTFYQVFVGKGAAFEGRKGLSLGQFTKGLSGTVLMVEAGKAVPWTKPEDLPYAADQPLPPLGGMFADGVHVLWADGRVQYVPRREVEKILRLGIPRYQGRPPPSERVGPDPAGPPAGMPSPRG